MFDQHESIEADSVNRMSPAQNGRHDKDDVMTYDVTHTDDTAAEQPQEDGEAPSAGGPDDHDDGLMDGMTEEEKNKAKYLQKRQ